MTKRDTYHDYFTAQELVAAGPRGAAALQRSRMDGLAIRSGAVHVRSAVGHWHQPAYPDIVTVAVHFDSAAWTGRNG